MRNASSHRHQCKVKISGSKKKVNEKTYDVSFIKRVTKKFLEVSKFRSFGATEVRCNFNPGGG